MGRLPGVYSPHAKVADGAMTGLMAFAAVLGAGFGVVLAIRGVGAVVTVGVTVSRTVASRAMRFMDDRRQAADADLLD